MNEERPPDGKRSNSQKAESSSDQALFDETLFDQALYDALLRVARKRVGQELAMDVVHDAILSALQHYGHQALANEPLLVRCVVHRAIDVQRGKAKALLAPQELPLRPEILPWSSDPEEEALAALTLEEALAILARQKHPAFPVPIALCVACGYSLSALARIFRMPRAMLKQALFHERKALRRSFAQGACYGQAA